jgi:DnaJ-domain-containing protein 1
MTDYFALLDEPRRPWLDADSLKKKFHALSAGVHPDRIHSAAPAEKAAAGKQFAELNAAYTCLREPKERLRHLLELELGGKPKDLHQIPPDLADLFIEIAGLCKQVDGFLAEKAKVSSPLLLAQLFERGQEWADRLVALQRKINPRQEAQMTQLQSLDKAWVAVADGSAARGELLLQLEGVWRLLGFFTRWNGQIQERFAQIAF